MSAIYLGYFAAQMGQFALMTDELLYQRVALSFARTLNPIPHIHDQSVQYYGVLYSWLTAPLYLFPTHTTFLFTHLLNAVLMASSCVPAYLLARSVGLSPRLRYLAAAITAFVPWTVFVTMTMTESLAYPVFLWALVAIHHCVMNPGSRGDLLALTAVGFAFFTRTQFIALAAVLPIAVLAHEILWNLARARTARQKPVAVILGSAIEACAKHRVLTVAVGLGALALIAAEATGGASRVVGAYSSAAQGPLRVKLTLIGAPETIAILAAGIGVVPLIGWFSWICSRVFDPGDRADHALAMISGVAVAIVALLVSAFNVRSTGVIVERYAFYLVPLFVIGMLAFLANPRLRTPALVFGGVAAGLVMLTFDRAIGHLYSWASSITDEYSRFAGELGVMPGRMIAIGSVVAAAALVIVWRFDRSQRAALVIGVLVLAATLAQTHTALSKATDGQPKLHRGQDWIDRAVGGDADVALVSASIGDQTYSAIVWWDAEFWNRSVRRQWMAKPFYASTGLPSTDLSFDPKTGLASYVGSPDHLILPITDKRFELAGRKVKSRGLLTLFTPARPIRALWTISGGDADGWTLPATPVSIKAFAPANASRGTRATVTAEIVSDQRLPRHNFTITGGERPIRGVVEPGGIARARVPVCLPPGGGVTLSAVSEQFDTIPGIPTPKGVAVTGASISYAGSCVYRAR
ncbi:MAG: hypothetical protein WAP35_03295 [Solirubrobacterales bacterium]